jgi:hypothetical protein
MYAVLVFAQELFDEDAMSETPMGEVLITTTQLMEVISGTNIEAQWFDLQPSADARSKSAVAADAVKGRLQIR